jgi:YcaO-like protein with predicted kinase domain
MDYGSTFDLKSCAARLGVSRIADLTGLDRVGYPVAAAIRPMSRNLSVHFGKGPSADVARLTAVMEAAELFYSERPPDVLVERSYTALPSGSACDPTTLAPELDDDTIRATSLSWTEGRDLVTGASRLVPWQTTDMDFTATARQTKRLVGFGATGLAAGFHADHAIRHGLLEVVERDCHDRWNELDDEAQLQSQINPETCKDVATTSLLKMIAQAELAVLLWEMTNDTEIPCYLAEVCDFASDAPTPYAQGAAAHPDAHVAIRKAVAEALQVRLTYIAGGRDDLDWSDYGTRYDVIMDNRRWLLAEHPPQWPFPEPKTSAPPTTIALAQRLGPGRPVTVIRLSPPQEPVVVVKVVVPHMADTPDADAFAEYAAGEKKGIFR